MSDAFWIDLVAIILLVLLGFAGGRLAERFGLPAVTAFLLVGVVFGPYGLGLLRADLMTSLAFVEPLALGLIVFLVGEELTPRTLRSRTWAFWLTTGLAVALPLLFVGYGTYLVEPDHRLAWLLAIIGLSGAPATVMAVLHESKTKGNACNTLLGTAAIDNVVTVVLYAIAVPVLLSAGTGSILTATGLQILQQIGAAIVVGGVVGFGLAKLLERPMDGGQTLLLGLAGVALVVALDEVLHSSVILACVTAGIVVAANEESRGERGRLSSTLSPIKYGVYIIFCTLAGAALQPGLALSAGVLAVVYIVARTAGRIGAGLLGGLAGGYGTRGAMLIGIGLLPQAGVAIGLALDAGRTFATVGPTVNAVVLAAVVVFELLGPLGVRKAVAELGEPIEEEIPEGLVCANRTVAVAVGSGLDGQQVLGMLDATHLADDGCPLGLELIRVEAVERGVGGETASGDGDVLRDVSATLRAAGHNVGETVIRSANVERGVARAVADSGATMLLIPASGSEERRRFLGGSLKRRRHKIADAAGVPTILVDTDKVARIEPEDAGVVRAAEEEGSDRGADAEQPAPAGGDRVASRERAREDLARSSQVEGKS